MQQAAAGPSSSITDHRAKLSSFLNIVDAQNTPREYPEFTHKQQCTDFS